MDRETQMNDESWCLVMDDTGEDPELYEDLPEIPEELRAEPEAYIEDLKLSQ